MVYLTPKQLTALQKMEQTRQGRRLAEFQPCIRPGWVQV